MRGGCLLYDAEHVGRGFRREVGGFSSVKYTLQSVGLERKRRPMTTPFELLFISLALLLDLLKMELLELELVMVSTVGLRPVVYSSLIGFTSCIVKFFRSRRSFISSPLWTP